jgi:hypothetical protein
MFMIEVWISAFTMVIITLGFGRILGDLIYQLRSHPDVPMAFLSLLVTNLVIFPPLSLPLIFRVSLWAAALSVTAIFAIRPRKIPEFLLSRRFILRYACLAMLTSAMWYLTAEQSLLMSALAASALLAALLSWRESLQW